MRPQPKKRTPRDSHYLAWIRTLPCVIPTCKKVPSGDSHHTDTGGMSLVGSDYSAVPLCRVCHGRMHDHQGKKHHWKEEELAEIHAGYLTAFKEFHKDNPKRLEHIEEQLRGAW